MRDLRAALRQQRDYMVFVAALLVMALHSVYATFIASRLSSTTLLLEAGALLALALGIVLYAFAGNKLRIALATCFGLPALSVGLGIHAIHAGYAGFSLGDLTGLALAVAGCALILLALAKAFRSLRPWPVRIVLLPVVYLLVFYLTVPVTLGVFAANVPHLGDDRTPSSLGLSYEEVSFLNRDGTRIAAWYIPSQNRAAVITVHGASGNRSKVLDQAALLAGQGYGVLMIDVEGFGASEGRSNNFGWLGARDVAAGVEFLRGRTDVDPQRIGALGLSMGAEIALTAAGEGIQLNAVVTEGAGVRSWGDYRSLPHVDWPAAPPFVTAVTLAGRISRADEPPRLVDAVRASTMPILLISANIDKERQMNGMLSKIDPSRVGLWEIPEDAHTKALELHPDEYRARVVGFFNDNLLRP